MSAIKTITKFVLNFLVNFRTMMRKENIGERPFVNRHKTKRSSCHLFLVTRDKGNRRNITNDHGGRRNGNSAMKFLEMEAKDIEHF